MAHISVFLLFYDNVCKCYVNFVDVDVKREQVFRSSKIIIFMVNFHATKHVMLSGAANEATESGVGPQQADGGKAEPGVLEDEK